MIPILLLASLQGAPAPAAGTAQEPAAPTPLSAPIVEVTVYPGSAVVRRRAPLPSATGRFLLRGLPRSLDPDALRVRAVGAEIVGVDLRERVTPAATDARIEELRARAADVQRRLAANADDQGVATRLREHVEALLEPPLPAEPADAAPAVERWAANLAYLEARLTELNARDRALEAAARDLRRELEGLQLELGRVDAQGGVRTFDLLVDALALSGDAVATLEVDYLVPDAAWTPAYDLRAPKDLAAVELVYRARVRQETGEDWRDVALLLSTARPRTGAQGPEPEGRWVGVKEPRARYAVAAAEAPREEAVDKDAARAYRKALEPTLAAVLDEGLSVRFRLPSRETVESRQDSTNVLVGRASLAIRPEHYCIPALDTTVWLRAEATNESEYVLLPGRAAVYLGADFLGHADLGAVQRGETFTLPLGPDPGLAVERVQLADLSGERGVFRSKRTRREAWRVELENHGALSRAADGAVQVIVHEALPKVRDDRIEVDLEDVRPRLAEGERWKTLRQEKGALTWLVRVPRGGAATVEHTLEIAYPEDLTLVRRIDR